MAFEIILAPEAVDDLRNLDAHRRAKVVNGLELHLRHEPTKLSRSRIKRLRGMSKPQYRLRIDDHRIFYDVNENIVEVLAIVSKEHADGWLEREGEADEGSGAVGGEG